ncbi:hypothetical protein CEXT_613031 [Caerostris extrusa]|uniref:Uncharacterized protein n=1 Tax=Caerostris extrusa TaxID=172846 RepID=A0AAV4V1Q3_CAEEX|nr:hypothetical protein CEXT_613031 [Caerostris extrusa]
MSVQRPGSCLRICSPRTPGRESRLMLCLSPNFLRNMKRSTSYLKLLFKKGSYYKDSGHGSWSGKESHHKSQGNYDSGFNSNHSDLNLCIERKCRSDTRFAKSPLLKECNGEKIICLQMYMSFFLVVYPPERSLTLDRLKGRIQALPSLKNSLRKDYVSAENIYGQKTSDSCRIQGRICGDNLVVTKDEHDHCQSHRTNPYMSEKCTDFNCKFNHSNGENNALQLACSHSDLCAKCSHATSCCCQKSHQKNSHPEKLDSNSLEQTTLPLNAARLKPRKHRIKNDAVVSISAERQVIVELLKTRNKQQFVSDVCIISTDGMEIKLYKPKKIALQDCPPPLPTNSKEIKFYNFTNFPKTHWKMYLIAKTFVDILRARTPKLTFFGKNAKCIMMENSPDPDFKMDFYDGGSVKKEERKSPLLTSMAIL